MTDIATSYFDFDSSISTIGGEIAVPYQAKSKRTSSNTSMKKPILASPTPSSGAVPGRLVRVGENFLINDVVVTDTKMEYLSRVGKIIAIFLISAFVFSAAHFFVSGPIPMFFAGISMLIVVGALVVGRRVWEKSNHAGIGQ